MSDADKKVFISYRRRIGGMSARAIYLHLRSEGYDVFMDVENLDSGEFPSVILHQIEARPHFLIVLVPGTLERTLEQGDWLLREIEHALRSSRNIVPLLIQEFRFTDEEKRLGGRKLPPKVKELENQSGVTVPHEYFDEAMKKLTTRFLKQRVQVALTPTPAAEQPTVERMLLNASLATMERPGTWTWTNRKALDAPQLSKSAFGCQWTAIAGATGYVLQRCSDAKFARPADVYDGDETTFSGLSFFARGGVGSAASLLDLRQDWYYRVKAKGGFAFLDSDWSNVVTFSRLPATLDAPVLSTTATGLSWTKISGARSYVLQVSDDVSFAKGTELYAGTDTEWRPPKTNLLFRDAVTPPLATFPATRPTASYLSIFARKKFYRVKAKGGLVAADSAWSNVESREIW